MNYNSDLGCVLKVENNSWQPLNIRGIFTDAGEIPELYPHHNGVPGQFHYFVEYQRRDSVEHALHLRLGLSAGLHVYPIESDSLLVEQFRSCKAYGSPHRFSASRNNTPTWPHPPPDHHDPQSRQERRQEKRPMDHRSFDLNVVDLAHPAPDDLYSPLAPSHSGSSSAPRTDFTSNSAHIFRTYASPSTGASIGASRATSPPYSLDTRLILDIQGERKEYDLAQDPGEDPKIIIELLKLSKSERRNWMLAGAHFRRIGEPQAAVDVMYAMLEVMTQHGYTVDSLKAVFICLAGCESDLAQIARNAFDVPNHDWHSSQAKWWLQKVYGPDSPTLKIPLPNALVSSRVKSSRVSPQPPPSREVPAKLHRYNPMSRACRKLRVDEGSSREHRPRNRGPPRMGRPSTGRGNYSRTKESRRKM